MITHASLVWSIERQKWQATVVYNGKKYGALVDDKEEAERIIGRTVLRHLQLN